MTNNINKRIIITITSIILIVSLVCALLMLIDKDTKQNEAVAEEILSANSTSTDGMIDGVENKHATYEKLQNKAIAAGKTLKTISTQSELENFLATNVATDYGALYNVSGELTLDWSSKIGGENSSKWAMKGIFDGNGYTINIVGGMNRGAFNYTTYQMKNNDARLGGSDADIKLRPSGFFVAYNTGSIINTNFVYTSTHQVPNGNSGNGATSLYCPYDWQSTPTFGIIAGISDGGTLQNCKLTIKNHLVLYETGYEGGLIQSARFLENSCIVGGAVGLATNGAMISNLTLDIKSTATIMALAHGCRTGANSQRAALACAGGIVGNYVPINGTKIQYCTLLGAGSITAIAGAAAKDDRFHAFVGGIAGGSFYFTGPADWANYNMNNYPNAEVTAVMSDWKGMVMSNQQKAFNMTTLENDKEYGKLFGAIGSSSGDLTGVSGMVFLYDYKTFCEAKGKKNSTYLDSWWKKFTIDNIGTMIYPTSTGGQVDVSFDNSNPKYDIRIEAKADGFDGDLSQTLENTYFKKLEIADGEYGNFIWEANINKNGQTSKHIKAEEYVGGEIFLLKATDYGTMNYSFGEIADYSISSNNGLVPNKEYDSDPIKEPTLVLKSKLGNSLTVNPNAYQWELLKSDEPNPPIAVTNSQTFLPGTYTYRAYKMLEQEKLAYYDETNKVLARYKEGEKETFTVQMAELKYDAPNENVWLNQANIGMYIIKDKSWMFNYIQYSVDGSWSGLQPTFGVSKYIFKDNVTTGESGRTYAFRAYVQVGTEYIQVARSNVQVKVRIDNEKPKIEDVHYYLSDSEGTQGQEITVSDLNEWRTTPILMKYTVNDEGLSGLVSGSGHTDYTTNPDGTWSCSVLLKDTKTYTLSYTDATNNTVSITYNVKIDNVNPIFNVVLSSGNKVQISGGRYYYSEALKVTYNATMGESGYDLYVSTATDDSIVGEDKRVWIRYEGALSNTGEMLVDEELNSQEIWYKLVNKQGLYDDVLVQLVNASMTKFTIQLAIADIYITTANIFTAEGVAFSEMDLSQVLSKTFDNKTLNKIEGAYVKLYQEDGTSRYGIGAIEYCRGRTAESDKVIQEALEVFVKYENKHAGQTVAYLYVQGKEDYESKNYVKLYPVYFTDYEIILDEEGFATNLPENPSKTIECDVTISKYNMSVDVPESIKRTYTFGDAIPATFDVDLIDGTSMTFDVTGGLVTYCNAGTYTVSGKAQMTHADIDFSPISTTVVVNKKDVSAIPTLDGEKNFSAKRDYDNKEHVFAATFKDVYGEIQPVNVQFFQNYERTTPYTDEAGLMIKSIRNAGYYYVKFSTSDTNYNIVNWDEFELEIVKAFMELELGTREMDYTGRAISYDFTVKADSSLYSMEDFKLTYYPYPSTAVYDPVNKKITSGKPLSTPIAASDVINVGYYSVTIEFKENANFYTQTYNDSLLVIVRAETEIVADDVIKTYTGDDFIFNHQDANTVLVGKNTGVVLANNSGEDEEGNSVAVINNTLVTINVRNATTGAYEEVTPTIGWYSDAGDDYTYKLIYAGDENHMPCEKEVKLIINKATFEGVVFESVTKPYSGKNVSVAATVPDNYSGYTISYTSGAKNQTEPFSFVDANTYKVKVLITMDNYENFEKTIEIKIDKINLTGVSARNVNMIYDGNAHRAELNGLTKDGNGNYTYNGLKALVTATDVEATNVGIKKGKYVIIVNNYNPLTVETTVNITPYEVPNTEVSYQSLSAVKFNTTTDLSELTATYTDVNGTVQTNRLRFYKVEDGVETEVGLKSDGTLPAGTYRAYVATDQNHKISNYAEFTIVSNTSEESGFSLGSKQIMIIIGAVAGVVVLVGVIAGIAIAAKKKKNSAI